MDKHYCKLFTEIAQATEVLAEKAMELHHKKGDEKGENTAKTMREDYTRLHDKMVAEDFDYGTLTKGEYAKLAIGAALIARNIEARLKTTQLAYDGYQKDILPKLQQVIDAKTEEEALKIANENFQVYDGD